MTIYQSLRSWLSTALRWGDGPQQTTPPSTIVEGVQSVGLDGALQIAAVWSAVDVIVRTVSTLPVFVYRTDPNGRRAVDRDSTLWSVLHERPNRYMTPAECWGALLINLLLKGNAYAVLERNTTGECISLLPISSDQVNPVIMPDGALVYEVTRNAIVQVYASSSILHIKGMGGGITGLSRIDYMRATVGELVSAQAQSARTFRNGGKPSGVLMIDRVLSDDQRAAIRSNFSNLTEGGTQQLMILEAGAKYEAVSLSSEDIQLLSTRQYGVEEIGRWFGVPAVLMNHSNTTTWGSGIEQIVSGFFKLTIRPLLVQIEQSVRARLMTVGQRATHTVEFQFEGLLRGSTKERYDIYVQAVNNGLMTRNEARQLENWPAQPGADALTAQINLAPLGQLGNRDGNKAS